MYKKNYRVSSSSSSEQPLTNEEQKLWAYISAKEIVDTELVSNIFPDMPAGKRNKLLHSLCKKGRLNRARKNIYYNPLAIKSFYELALMVKDGYIGLSSALRYYNLLDYEDFTIFVIT